MSIDNQPKTRKEWFALVDEHASSGLSQTEFCKEHNLILHRFTYFKQQQAKATFTPVKIGHETVASGSSIKIDLPNGFCCHVPSTISVDKLKVIIGALILC